MNVLPRFLFSIIVPDFTTCGERKNVGRKRIEGNGRGFTAGWTRAG